MNYTLFLPFPSKNLSPNGCSIDGCQKHVYARRWCKMHYRRWQRFGDPTKILTTPFGEPKGFLDNLAVEAQRKECILWPYAKNPYGYGKLRINGKYVTASRYICSHYHGAEPFDKAEAAHSCGNRLCVNPSHLRWATRAENEADKIAHGTSNRGERNWASKLTSSDVIEIRRLYDSVEVTDLANKYSVTNSTIIKIQRRERWQWL